MSWPLIEFTIEINHKPELVYANETVTEITGYSIELLNKVISSPEKLIQAEDLLIFKDLLNEKNQFVFPLRIIDAMGNTKWIEVAVYVISEGKKKATIIRGYGWDISKYLTNNEKLSNKVHNQNEKLQKTIFLPNRCLKPRRRNE